MFRRLLAWFGLPFASLVPWSAAASPLHPGRRGCFARRQLRQALLLASFVLPALTLVVGPCFWWSWRLARSVGELTRAVENIGGNARVFLSDKDDLGSLGRTFNRISERLTTRIAHLEEDRQQLRTILSGMVEGVVALDSDQRILFANDRAADLMEFSGQLPVGRPLWEVVRQRSLIDVIRRALDSPEAQREEINWTGSASRSLTVHAARLPGAILPLVGGGPAQPNPRRGAVLVLHDTTELRRLERLRQEFVANVSHELKTPLSVIKLCVETLQNGAAEDAHHRDKVIGQVARHADRLEMLIHDLLSLARIESGNDLYDFQAVAVEPLVACLHRASAAPRRRQASGSWKSTLSPGEVQVWGDEEALEQILDNLLDNAIEIHARPGRARRLARPEGEQAAH